MAPSKNFFKRGWNWCRKRCSCLGGKKEEEEPYIPTVGVTNIVPAVEILITNIEEVGLETEGLYRKSGVASRVQQLKKSMEEDSAYNLQEQNIHVLSSVLKSILREIPDPLLTNDRYEDFLKASDISDPNERTSSLMALVNELPSSNFHLLQLLLSHLARVALNEESNRMSPNALSIVFAPCILRTNKVQETQDLLSAVCKQTLVVETILLEQLRQVSNETQIIEPSVPVECTTQNQKVEQGDEVPATQQNENLPPVIGMEETPSDISEDQNHAMADLETDPIDVHQAIEDLEEDPNLATEEIQQKKKKNRKGRGAVQKRNARRQKEREMKVLNEQPADPAEMEKENPSSS